MKKILYILFCLVPLLTMQSCTEHLEENLTNERKLSTTISVIIPQLPSAHPQTRAMGIQPDVNSLHVAVFDENGYLLEYVEATYKDEENNIKTYVAENYKICDYGNCFVITELNADVSEIFYKTGIKDECIDIFRQPT